jgi:hypothetical protein
MMASASLGIAPTGMLVSFGGNRHVLTGIDTAQARSLNRISLSRATPLLVGERD